MHKGLKNNQEEAVLSPVLTSLVEYIQTHFSFEKQELKKFNYPEIDSHMDKHKKLVGQVSDFYAKHQSGQAKIDVGLMEFLKDWLNNHIKVVDKGYSSFMVSSGIEAAHEM